MAVDLIQGEARELLRGVTADYRPVPPNDYAAFLQQKLRLPQAMGRNIEDSQINPLLFRFQRDIVKWAVRRGSAAVFADTGLGKTLMQLEWARLISPGAPVLIAAPLAVAKQTITEGRKLELDVVYSRDGSAHPFTVTNYEMLAHFDAQRFHAVVLDESSILKCFAGKIRSRLIAQFGHVPYRLCCTATPAPNDIEEIGNHAEFLGILTRAEMLATFYVHDDTRWRLKGHAEDAFYRWLAGWSMALHAPSDLGYDDDGFVLPPLEIVPQFIATAYQIPGALFATRLRGISERLQVRRETIPERCAAAAALAEQPGAWIFWCNLNEEGRSLARLIPDSVLIEGSDELNDKLAKLDAFVSGSARVLISKPRICGFGMNFQHCHQMAFVGLSDSWEQYYQAIRRCYRYRQTSPVQVHIILSEAEQPIYENVMRKEAEAMSRAKRTIEHVRDTEIAALADQYIHDTPCTDEAAGEGWRLLLGDAVVRLREIRTESVGLSVFSPPFASLYTYTASPADLGNSASPEEFWQHFSYIIRELLRITQPGRNCCVHVAQVPAMLVRDGYIGLKDLRGQAIQNFQDAGWVYHGEVCIDKDPQAQAIRTKSKALLFVQMRRDASWLRPALADYILVFRKPGENPAPILPEISNNQWIEWARPIWYGIRETNTLSTAEAREQKDERHICPLQLETIERCLRLWSNPGDLICSPFAGIGSEGHVALKEGRHFIGIELKRAYWQAAIRNLKHAEDQGRQQGSLFGQ